VNPEEIREKLKMVPCESGWLVEQTWRVPHSSRKQGKNGDKLKMTTETTVADTTNT